MKIYTKVESEKVSAIKCDCCHKTYTDYFELLEFFLIKNRCGYASIFGDGNKIEVDICQHCMKGIIEEYCGNINNFIDREETY